MKVICRTVVFSEDALGRNRKTSCRVGVSLGLHVSMEYSQDHDHYTVPSSDHKLDERVQNGILGIFFDRNIFTRINAQENRVSDFESIAKETSVSWVLGYQNIEGLAAYCGLNHTQTEDPEDADTREYFAKLSFTL
jgi:hypothetical protein